MVIFLNHRFLVVLIVNGDTSRLTAGFLKEASHKKYPGVLEIFLVDIISHVVTYQGSMANTPTTGITRHNQSMLVTTDQGASLCPNIILTHCAPTPFFICKSVFQLTQKWCLYVLVSGPR